VKLEEILSQPKEEACLPKQPLTAKLTENTDPLNELLKGFWEIECDKCGKMFKHSFTDEEIYSLESNGYTYVDCPTCKDYPPYDIAGWLPANHRIFIRLAYVFRAYLQGSRIIKVKEF
jgi:phage FluMu protein Com